jgi:hypothetical protein
MGWNMEGTSFSNVVVDQEEEQRGNMGAGAAFAQAERKKVAACSLM